MISHKVVDMKITYEPENMDNMEELEKKIDSFLNDIKGAKGVKISAKKHDVHVNVMLDEYGVEVD